MNEKPFDILLSAYLDGEVSPEERVTVEEQLAASPEAQQEMRELNAVRELLRSLPRETLSDDFTAAVLQQSERASLLPDEAPAEPRKNASTRPRFVVIGSLVATAAVLFLMSRLLTTTGTGDPEATTHLAGNEPLAKSGGNRRVALESDSVSGKGQPSVADASSDRLLKDADGAPGKAANNVGGRFAPEAVRRSAAFKNDSASKVPRANRQFSAKNGVAKALTVRKSPSQDAEGARFGNNRSRESIRRELLQKLQAGLIEIGDVFPYFENRGNQTAVIEVTVVDVQKTVGRLQLLLAKNSIPRAGDKSKDQPDDGKNKKTAIAARNSGDLIAVYVESSSPLLTAAVKELTRNDGKLRFALKPPVELTEVLLADARRDSTAGESPQRARGGGKRTLADAIARNLQWRSRTSGGGLGGASAGKSAKQKLSQLRKGKKGIAPQKNADTKTDAKKAERKAKPSQTGPAGALAGGGSKPSTDSFHFQLRVPKSTVSQKPRAPAVRLKKRSQDKAQRRSRVANASRTGDNKADETKSRRAAPLRVIFVFRKSPPPRPRR